MESEMAKTSAANPCTWQEQYGFSQGVVVEGGKRVLYCAGQTSVDGDGNPMHAGNMAAQLAQAFDNLQAVLAEAGMGFHNVVRLNYYTTDVADYMEAARHVADPFASLGVKPAGTLLGVAGLFHPDIMIEIEATAVD
jgi:enamine deaminase RidA (YjgF/YER057c/UK114 family)